MPWIKFYLYSWNIHLKDVEIFDWKYFHFPILFCQQNGRIECCTFHAWLPHAGWNYINTDYEQNNNKKIIILWFFNYFIVKNDGPTFWKMSAKYCVLFIAIIFVCTVSTYIEDDCGEVSNCKISSSLPRYTFLGATHAINPFLHILIYAFLSDSFSMMLTHTKASIYEEMCTCELPSFFTNWNLKASTGNWYRDCCFFQTSANWCILSFSLFFIFCS